MSSEDGSVDRVAVLVVHGVAAKVPNREFVNLEAITDLPGLDELQAAGLFEGKLPPGYGLPDPNDEPTLRADEEPLGEPAPLDQAWGPIPPDESA